MKKKSRNSIYIGNKDIYEWTMGEGKDYLFPLIFNGAKELIKNYTKEELDEIHCARVEVEIRKNKKASYGAWETFFSFLRPLSTDIDIFKTICPVRLVRPTKWDFSVQSHPHYSRRG